MEAYIKSSDKDKIVVAGYAVVFGGKDLQGERFTKETDYDLDWIPVKKVLYDHNGNGSIKGVIGSLPRAGISIDDVGLFVEAEILKSNRYATAIQRLTEAKVLGFSTGTLPQLMSRKKADDGIMEITSWPIAEVSLTTMPAEPRTLGVAEIKQLAEDIYELRKWVTEDESPEAASKTATAETEDPQTDTELTEEGDKKMSDVNINTGAGKPDSQAEANEHITQMIKEFSLKAVEANEIAAASKERVETLSSKMDRVLDFIDSSAAAKAGYITSDGGKADPDIKNFGDFLMSIKRKDTARLKGIYGATKDLGEDDGASGGYLVPAEYEETLLNMAARSNPISQGVKRIPVTRASGTWPALDQYLTPSAGSGNTAMAAGVSASITPAGENLTETTPYFNMIDWRLHKIGGFTEVDNELIEDSPFAIEALLTGLFGVAVGSKNERNILRGNGVGQPLGILNSAAAIGVSPATNNVFAWADVASMYSRYMSAGGNPVWVIHPGIWPDILTMEIGTAGGNAWTANMQGPAGNNINGYPIVTSEHMPQDDNAGCVLLADLSAYLFFEKRGLSIAFSEHAAFTSEKGTWRFSQRNDGKTWMQGPVTLADPQGSYTVSPYVYLND